MFRTILDEVLQKVDGAICVSLMGIDGIPIEEVRRPEGVATKGPQALNLDLIAAEYAAVQKRVAKTTEGLDLDSMRELAVVTDGHMLLLSTVSKDYFLLLLLDAPVGMGKARHELRKAQLKLRDEVA